MTTSNNLGDKQFSIEKSRSIIGNFFYNILNKVYSSRKISKTRKAVILNDLIDATAPDTDFFIMIIFSCTIATFGLIANLSVVTIGAQLIDPLMSPILGLAIASLSGLHRMFKQSVLAIIKGALLSLVLSTAISFIGYRLPNGINAPIPNEILLRTVATPIDLGIALIGGAAAAYALAHPRPDATMAGVAIATALMPPLCTFGFGIAFFNPRIMLGASLQFFTNFVAIAFSAISVFALFGFKPIKANQHNSRKRPFIVSALLMLIIAIPLVVLAWSSLSAAQFNNLISNIVIENLPSSAEAQLINLDIQTVEDIKEVSVTLRLVNELSPREAMILHKTIADQFVDPIKMRIITIPVQLFE